VLRKLKRLRQLIPKLPEPTEKQWAFLTYDVGDPVPLEALYGGAAGGGKSTALLMSALLYIDVPGYSALILRRTYTDLALPGALMDMAHDWLEGSAATWHEMEKTWRFPSGATLTFGYLESERDKYRYQSAEFTFLAFDELTQFTESQYRYLLSRLRKPEGLPVPLRVRCATNPGGVGHDWVRRRFIEEGPIAGRVYLPATLDDNPHLDREAYLRSLNELDPITRAQLLEGDWNVRSGRMFRREWFRIAQERPAGVRLVRYWDLAATEPKAGRDPDYTAGALVGLDEAGNIWICHIVRARLSPGGVEELVRQTATVDGPGVPIYIEEEPGASGKALIDHYQRRVLPGYTVRPAPASGSKVARAQPLAARAEAGQVYILNGPWVTGFLDEAEAFPEGAHDDQVDAAAGACQVLWALQKVGFSGVRAVLRQRKGIWR